MEMQDNTPHLRRLLLAWVLSSIVLTAVVVFVLAPGMPPGDGSVQAHGQVIDDVVLFGLSTPVALGVLMAVGYCLIFFRDPGDNPALEGPPIRGNSSIQMWWLVASTTLVLFLAAFGSIELLKDGAGGGQGPNPLSKPAGASNALDVQVIAQQWEFTYRYPQYGGFETSQLVIPAHRTVEFQVTSLDVVHSFWAYQLGVKADANPGENNIAYVQTLNPMHFEVHCAELCGVWHGYMYDSGRVVPGSQFASWASQQKATDQPIIKHLPKFDKTYFPAPERRGG